MNNQAISDYNAFRVRSMNILIKGLIVLKSIVIVFVTLCVVSVALELYTTRDQIEGRELIEATPEALVYLIVVLFAFVTTLLFDIKTIKHKEALVYKNWAGLLLLLISVVVIIAIFEIHWIVVLCLMLLLGFYATYLLFKFQQEDFKK